MAKTAKNRKQIETLVLGGILTAIVFIIQFAIAPYMKFGTASLSLILIPIVIGAATCSIKISTWLGLVFSIAVLIDPATSFFYSNFELTGTIITILAKGIACGFMTGLVYQKLENKNVTLATYISAITAPLVNTAVFILGCFVFFYDKIQEMFGNAIYGIFIGFIGINFPIELALNIILAPIIIRILKTRKKSN